jgi:hypothetical protein
MSDAISLIHYIQAHATTRDCRYSAVRCPWAMKKPAELEM